MRVNEIVAEGIDYRGNPGTDPEMRRQALDKSHTLDDAEAYQAQQYPFRKRYAVRRAEVGFRAMEKPGEAQKSATHMSALDSAVDQLQLKVNPYWTGSAQAEYDGRWSASIGWSWHFLENTATGISILYYQDRGMGSDEIIVGATSQAALAGARRILIDAGVLPDPADAKMKTQAKAAANAALAAKSGLAAGKTVTLNGVQFEVAGFTSSGRVKLVRLSPTGDPSQDKLLVSPRYIKPEHVS